MRPAGALALLAVCWAAIPAAGAAGEARARGKKAVIRWVEADGSASQADARKISYGYWERRLLSVERKGRKTKDTMRSMDGLPVAGNFIPFTRIERIDFGGPEEAGAGPALTLTIALWDGTTLTVKGSELAGATHPVSPFISFTAEGVVHTVDLNPLGPDEENHLATRLLELSFYP